LNAGLTCTAPNNGIDRKYELTNPFGGANYTTSATNLAITLGLVTNPDVSGNAGGFQIDTYMTQGGTDYLVDTATYSSVTITAGSLTSPLATSNSTEAYNSNVLFTFSFTTQHAVSANGLIDITLPSTVVLFDSSAAIAGCTASLNGVALIGTVCTNPSSTTMRVTNLFPIAGTGNVVISFPGLRNPRNQGPSSSFTITTTDSSSNIIDTQNSGFIVTMSSVADLQNVAIQNTQTVKINGVFDPYQVFITAQTPTVDGDKVVIVFPTDMDFPTSSGSLS